MSGLYKVCLLREVSSNFSRSTLYIMALENDVKSVEFLLNHGIPQIMHIKAIFTTYNQKHHDNHDHHDHPGANTELKDADGRTALHVAAWQGYTDIVQVMVMMINQLL